AFLPLVAHWVGSQCDPVLPERLPVPEQEQSALTLADQDGVRLRQFGRDPIAGRVVGEPGRRHENPQVEKNDPDLPPHAASPGVMNARLPWRSIVPTFDSSLSRINFNALIPGMNGRDLPGRTSRSDDPGSRILRPCCTARQGI